MAQKIIPKHPNVWFTADTHFSHKNILKYATGRFCAGALDPESETLTEEHDKWLIERWNERVDRRDMVFILGDFSFRNQEETQKLLGRLKGNKSLIIGNHDKSSMSLNGKYFNVLKPMYEITYKPRQFEFLEEDFRLFMCHYPMVSWNKKQYGVCQIHGHCHGRIDDYNEESPDLRVDVGIDGRLADFNLISLEELYRYFKGKTSGETFINYAQNFKTDTQFINTTDYGTGS